METERVKDRKQYNHQVDEGARPRCAAMWGVAVQEALVPVEPGKKQILLRSSAAR
jgi:hypothetical protein